LPQEQREGELFYRFAHDKIRETLLQNIPPARSQVLHGRIVQTLNKTSQQAAVLAHHYSGAGELRTAFRYWMKAAERARRLFAKEDASRSYAQAEKILQQIFPEVNNQEINQFYAGWGDLAYNATETDLLKHIGHELIRLGEIRENSLLIGSGLDALSNACMTINDFELGLEFANQAISHLEETENCYEMVEAYNHRGTFLYMLNHLEEALIAFQDALALCTDVSDPKINKALSNAHYQTALLQILFGKPIIGFKHGLKALEFAERIQHTYSIIQAYGIQSLAQFYLGEFTQARETALKGIEIAERIQGWRMLGYLNSYAAIAEVALGYLDEARRHAEDALQIGQKYEQHDISALGYRALGEIHRILHDYPQATQYFQKGYNGLPNHFLGFDNLYRLGLVQSYQKNADGVDKISLAKINLDENSVEVGTISAKLCLALVYAMNQEWQKIKPLASELGSETLANGLNSYHINAIYLLAEVAAADGDYESALEQFQFTAGEARFLQNPWLEIKAQAAIEKILDLMGEKSSRPGERIEALLDQLESQTLHPEIRPAFCRFREQVSTRTRIATDTL
jgi:tetratricopeptide (TPR) repeat protein